MRYFVLIFLIFFFTFSLFSEEFRYVVKYLGIKVGRLNIEIVNDNEVLNMKANLRTLGIFKIIHPVRDTVESKWNKKIKKTEYFKEEINEGNYHCLEETNSIPNGSIDPLALIYLFRFLDKKDEYLVYSHEKVKKVMLNLIGKENTNIYEKHFKTMKVVPSTEFKSLEGVVSKVRKMEMWLVGEQKIPLLIEVESKFGRITLLLENREKFVIRRNKNL